MEKNPNDADLVYNLGVIAFDGGQTKEAEQYFRKAVAINPEYANAYVNIAAIKFKEDKLIVDKMNALGTSAADNKKYGLQLSKHCCHYLKKHILLTQKIKM